MQGMDVHNGRYIEAIDHLKQSIADILSTPIGSRVMRRDYGSRLFEKIDRPINGELIADIYVDVIDALSIWEPRFDVVEVTVATMDQGKLVLDIEGRYLLSGAVITLEGISITSIKPSISKPVKRHDIATEQGAILTEDDRPLLY